jgi:hypothetical protein
VKWFWGFVLGTVLSTGFLGIFTWANGVPLPPLRDWRQVAAYPTGSAMTTFEVTWIIYGLSFIAVFTLAWTVRKMRRSSSR